MRHSSDGKLTPRSLGECIYDPSMVSSIQAAHAGMFSVMAHVLLEIIATIQMATSSGLIHGITMTLVSF